MNVIAEPEISPLKLSLRDVVGAATKRIPPLWSLKNFVAVNPFVGLSDRHFVEAAKLVQQDGHGEMLMPAQFYLDQIDRGRIRESDFKTAMEMAERILPGAWAEQIDFVDLYALQRALKQSGLQIVSRVLTFADFLDERCPTDWAVFVGEEISKWCAAYFDQGQSSWRMPWRDLSLFAAWKSAARLDANPELTGLPGFRAFVAALPDDPWAVISQALNQLHLAEALQPEFLHRQFMSLPGWSSYVQYLVREKSMSGQRDDSLAQLLAIRLVYDLALIHQFGNDLQAVGEWQRQLARMKNSGDEVSPELLARFVAQQALECGYQNELMANLKDRSFLPAASGPRSLQAIFCIDVRSEVYRRALEAQSDRIETIGFAGFFGMPIEHLRFGKTSGSAQCPVLLTPKFKVREALRQADGEAPLLRRMNFQRTVNGAWNAFKTSAISCFSFVETAGLWFGVKLAKDSCALTAAEPGFSGRRRQRFYPKIECEESCTAKDGPSVGTGIALEDQIALAAGALKNMGLVSNFAKVVLICGHGSATANNPYGSALDCGACGGHAGDVNARVAASILNQPGVREALKAQGIVIPSDTVFIAGLHNTTTEEIIIFEDESISIEQAAELEKIKVWLTAASKQARRERAASLGLEEVADSELAQKFYERSRDWSQVRPEWGLARNATFIAAPRERTKGLNLGGRAFLHNYHAHLDADGSTLELILTAPMVVASWINLQYYGSTVDNRLFGSGNKVLHNVVGTFGIWQGNGGDLQPGLPWQSIHDGTRLVHEPMRLSVFVEARRANIDAVLRSHLVVRELIDNSWIQLMAIEPRDGSIWRRLKGFHWEEAAA